MLVRRFLVLLALALAALAAPPNHAGAQSIGQRHFLWKVTGTNGGAVYLFGTVHLASADLYPLPSIVEDSFGKADTLVEEVDLSKADNAATTAEFVAQNGLYPSGDVVTNHLGGTTRDLLAQYAQENQLGAAYMRMKPWVLNLLIAQIEAKRFGLDKKGLDVHLEEEAVKLHKPIEGLETSQFQLELLSGFPDSTQDQLLLATLLEAKRSQELLREMLAAWKSGDAAALDDIERQEERRFPSLQATDEKLIYDRNDEMTRKIEEFLKTGKTYFVAVGAAHLVGDRGIVAQLRAQHYTVDQL